MTIPLLGNYTFPSGTYTLPSGTYTNYRFSFTSVSNFILSGNYVFNGDTAIVVDNGSIDARNATITVNYGGSPKKLVLAAPNGFITVAQITATDSDVYLHALGDDPTEMGTVRTVADGNISSPTVTARKIYLWAKPRLVSTGRPTTDTIYETVTITKSVSLTPSADHSIKLGVPVGLIVRSTEATGVTKFNVMNAGELYRLCYALGDAPRDTDISATSYQIVPTTVFLEQTSSNAISILDIAKEFGAIDDISITTISEVTRLAGEGLWYIRFGGIAIPMNTSVLAGDIVFINDFTLNDLSWGRVTQVYTNGPTAIEVQWYGPVNPYVGMPLAKLKTTYVAPFIVQPFSQGVAEGVVDPGASQPWRITATGPWPYASLTQDLTGYIVQAPDNRLGTIVSTDRTISGSPPAVTAYSHLILLTSVMEEAPAAGNYNIAPRGVGSSQLSTFYAGGAYVPAGTVGFPNGVSTPIPSSGTISYANFYGSSKQVVRTVQTTGIADLTLTAGTWYIYARAVGGGGGGAGGEGVFGSSGGVGSSWLAKFTVNAAQPGRLTLVAGEPGSGGGPDGIQKSQGGRASCYLEDTSTLNSSAIYKWYPVFRVSGGTSWASILDQEAVWISNFNSINTNPAPITVSVFFPTTGNYTFTGAASESFQIYLSSTASSGLIGDFSGYSSSKVVTVNVQAGWRAVYFKATDDPAIFSPVTNALALVIKRTSDNVQIFNTRGLTDGGYTSGGFWFLNGGHGGYRGTTSTSGSGGGGGAGTALLWYPNDNPRTAEPIVLGIAGGGGGGAGTGNQVNPSLQSNPPSPSDPRFIYLANWNIRGLVRATESSSIFTPAAAGGNSATWFGRAVGNRVPYVLPGTGAGLRGQGGNFARFLGEQRFFPPFQAVQSGTGLGTWNGGAGGGGGAPWGYAGGYAERPDSSWSEVDAGGGLTYWNAPTESAGSGGGQGFLFLNSNYVGITDFIASSGNQLQFNNGSGTYNGTRGNGGLGSGQTTNVGIGTGGAIAVRISNIDDGIYPAGFTPATLFIGDSSQTWRDVTSARVFGINYTNTTGAPIQLSVSGTTSGDGGGVFITVDGVTLPASFAFSGTIPSASATAVIPDRATYSASAYAGATGGVTLRAWDELTSGIASNNVSSGLGGIDQSWTNVSGSRDFGITYTNTTGKPIQIIVNASTMSPGGGVNLNINGTALPGCWCHSPTVGATSATAIVPVGATYSATAYGNSSYSSWFELRGPNSTTGDGIGYNQSWTNVSGSRGVNTTYTNTTGKPIQILVAASTVFPGAGVNLVVNGQTIEGMFCYSGGVTAVSQCIIVPIGGTYSASISGSGSYAAWYELR